MTDKEKLIIGGAIMAVAALWWRRAAMNKAQAFVDDFGAAAKAVANEFKLGPEGWRFILTQSANESNYGGSGLTRLANNFFGFTGEYWEKIGKPVVRMLTHEQVGGKTVAVTRPFRRYATPVDSFRDYARLITTKSNYTKSIAELRAGNLQRAIDEMGRSGYATQADYGQRLTRNLNELRPYLA